MAATIWRPSCALERGSLPVRIALREVLQLEAEGLGGLDPRDDHVARAVGQLVLAEVRRAC